MRLFPSTVVSNSECPMMFGRPNIIGGTNLCSGWGGVKDTGVFKKTGKTQSAGGMYDNGINLQFDASWSSALFGAGSTVQPSAMRFLACIKV